MSKTLRVASWMVVLSLSVPGWAEAQKNSGSAGNSGSGGNSGSSRSSGSSGASSSGSARAGGMERPGSSGNSAPAPPPPAAPRMTSDSPRSSSPKKSDPVRLGTAAIGSGSATTAAKIRGSVLPSGYAIARPPTHFNVIIAYPYYVPWGYWSPWYGGYGYGFGYGYNPWYYGPWGWAHFGFWYSPASYYSELEPETAAAEPEPPIMGAVRIRSNAENASVYVDGVRVGIVDDFNGLSDHLELEKGRHTIELRADGFESASIEVNVKAGQTQTVRLNLKR